MFLFSFLIELENYRELDPLQTLVMLRTPSSSDCYVDGSFLSFLPSCLGILRNPVSEKGGREHSYSAPPLFDPLENLLFFDEILERKFFNLSQGSPFSLEF